MSNGHLWALWYSDCIPQSHCAIMQSRNNLIVNNDNEMNDCLEKRIPFSSPLAMKETGPWNWLRLDPNLNTNQREVIRRILEPGNNSSPLVVFGPFGTGKTFTLNQAIRHLVTTKHNRILLCTHTNSAADIHVRLLHDYLTKENGLQATRPLRIYDTNRRSVNFKNL